MNPACLAAISCPVVIKFPSGDSKFAGDFLYSGVPSGKSVERRTVSVPVAILALTISSIRPFASSAIALISSLGLTSLVAKTFTTCALISLKSFVLVS